MTSFVRKLFGGGATELAPGRGWTVNVVGEARFQDALRALKGTSEHDLKVVATLVPEPSNKFDSGAVRVEISGRPVGYLSRALASEYTLERPSQCSAKITGGFALKEGTRAHFGVSLNLAWPPRPAIL